LARGVSLLHTPAQRFATLAANLQAKFFLHGSQRPRGGALGFLLGKTLHCFLGLLPQLCVDLAQGGGGELSFEMLPELLQRPEPDISVARPRQFLGRLPQRINHAPV